MTPDWIAVDWGTSSLRAWAMSADGRVLEARSSDKGMGKLEPADFGPALADLCDGWTAQPMTVVACGMVGSRQGWVEAPYASVPCPATPARLVRAPDHGPLRPWIVPGVSQSDPPDVMRGEETQIAGLLALKPGWDGVVCLPGTHTKWAEVSAGEIVSFRTFMTGEIFSLLSDHSVLRHSVSDGWDETAFAEAVADTLARPESLAARLFRIRADHLLYGTPGPTGFARLSGLLIGAELAAARPYWLGRQVAVIGAKRLANAYLQALAAQAVPADEIDAEAATLAGLTAAHAMVKEARA